VLYVDSSALVKLFLDEAGRAECADLLRSHPRRCSARHAYVEVQRAIARGLKGASLAAAAEAFEGMWSGFEVIDLDAYACSVGAALAIETRTRTLDALHLAAMWQAGGSELTMLTYDRRLADAARYLGMPVIPD
jgi:uncharacterized protein